jgi:hypothetical protein
MTANGSLREVSPAIVVAARTSPGLLARSGPLTSVEVLDSFRYSSYMQSIQIESVYTFRLHFTHQTAHSAAAVLVVCGTSKPAQPLFRDSVCALSASIAPRWAVEGAVFAAS